MFTPTGYNLITSNTHSDKIFVINSVTIRENGRLVVHWHLEDAWDAFLAEEELWNISYSFDVSQIGNYLPENDTFEEDLEDMKIRQHDQEHEMEEFDEFMNKESNDRLVSNELVSQDPEWNEIDELLRQPEEN